MVLFLSFYIQVAAVVHADLSADSDTTEEIIVSQFELLRRQNRFGQEEERVGQEPMPEEIKDDWVKIKKKLELLGFQVGDLVLRKVNSIAVYWISRSAQKLEELRYHYESGLMKSVLEKIFSLFAGENVDIRRLAWSSEEYNSSLSQLGE